MRAWRRIRSRQTGTEWGVGGGDREGQKERKRGQLGTRRKGGGRGGMCKQSFFQAAWCT
jgi:hypothetical protein